MIELPSPSEIEHMSEDEARRLYLDILSNCDDDIYDLIETVFLLGNKSGKYDLYHFFMNGITQKTEHLKEVSQTHFVDPSEDESFDEALARQFDIDELTSLRNEMQYLINRTGPIRPTKDMSLELDEVRFSAHLHYHIEFRTKENFNILLKDLNKAIALKAA